MNTTVRICVFFGLMCVAVMGALAQSNPGPVLQLQHPWQSQSPYSTADAYFTNLENNAVIETPFVIKFGLSGGWGLSAITSPVSGKSGHHHLLVNRDLPLDFKQALPFTEQYIHFGKGQMESVLNLKPGKYTLRLLLADHNHLPHFVFSKPLTVTVSRNNPGTAAPAAKGIALLNIAPGAQLKSPFLVRLHASQLNVGPRVQKEKDTGHFRLTIQPKDGTKPAEIVLDGGQTEVWIKPPPGAYSLNLELLDNANPGKFLAGAVTTPVQVQ
ncbi:MAG: DUF4399 domain-containing protein [Burkholderiaceae bacterium]